MSADVGRACAAVDGVFVEGDGFAEGDSFSGGVCRFGCGVDDVVGLSVIFIRPSANRLSWRGERHRIVQQLENRAIETRAKSC